MTAGSDGAIWYTAGNKVGRITTSGTATEYTLPAGSFPEGITTGPDGALYITEAGTNKIARLTTDLASYSDAMVHTGSSNPWEITTGPDGALWFVEPQSSRIGRSTTGLSTSDYFILTNANPREIVSDPYGGSKLWICDASDQEIEQITTGGGVSGFYYYNYTGGVFPSANFYDMAAGADHALYITAYNAAQIVRFDTTTDTFTDTVVGSISYSSPVGITAGPDGALWFTQYGGIGRITTGTSPTVTHYPLPQTYINQPEPIIAGPDGALWFGENKQGFTGGTNQIGRLQ
jgi:virginiamycin B lyase